MSAPSGQRLPPAGIRLRPDRSLRSCDGGRVLLGGYPGRLVRLRPAGADTVRRWLDGGVVSEDSSARRLARLLLDAGLVHPEYTESPRHHADVTVVVPVRDRTDDLARCLEALRATAAGVPVIVVDDASADPDAVVAVAKTIAASVVRHPAGRGAAAARNSGLATARTSLVAFVDSDVVVSAGWLPRLAAHFDDPAVAAVGPRVVAHKATSRALSAYEAGHSPLDMGRCPAVARPGSPVPFVPTAVLVVRRDACGDGFDERLPIGEDVDLEWRLDAQGWTVRYDPAVTVAHAHRVTVAPFVRRRWVYARSVSLLSKRHPHALPATRLSGPLTATLLLLLAGRPAAAAAATGFALARTARRLDGRIEHPVRISAQLVRDGLPATAEALARGVQRAWWPVLLPAAVRIPRLRVPSVAALGALAVADWWRAGRVTPLSTFIAVRTFDDVVGALGLWHGCLADRTIRPLLPGGVAVRAAAAR